MKDFLLPLAAFVLFSAQPPRFGTSFSRIDPQQVSLNYTHVEHLAGSLLLTHLSEYTLRKLGVSEGKARFWAPSIAFAVGCAKEAYDATKWDDRAGEGWDATDLVADFVGVGLGHLTYGNRTVDSFFLPVALGPTLYERVGDRSEAALASAAVALMVQPPAGDDRTARLLGLAGGTVAGTLSTYMQPQWTFDRERWRGRLD